MREYAALGDEEEAAHCWRDLDVTFFGHQLVYTILLAAFENPAKEDLLLRLIRRFEASGEVSQVCFESLIPLLYTTCALLLIYQNSNDILRPSYCTKQCQIVCAQALGEHRFIPHLLSAPVRLMCRHRSRRASRGWRLNWLTCSWITLPAPRSLLPTRLLQSGLAGFLWELPPRQKPRGDPHESSHAGS